MSSSFVKKINTTPQLYKNLQGVRPAQTGQMYLLGSGNPSLDTVLGGGIVVGSLNVLYEDCMSHFFSHFQKTYLGEGIVREQKCLIVDPEVLRTKEHWLKFLPAAAKVKSDPSAGNEAD
jgi:elongator complex protein 4